MPLTRGKEPPSSHIKHVYAEVPLGGHQGAVLCSPVEVAVLFGLLLASKTNASPSLPHPASVGRDAVYLEGDVLSPQCPPLEGDPLS